MRVFVKTAYFLPRCTTFGTIKRNGCAKLAVLNLSVLPYTFDEKNIYIAAYKGQYE